MTKPDTWKNFIFQYKSFVNDNNDTQCYLHKKYNYAAHLLMNKHYWIVWCTLFALKCGQESMLKNG